MLRSARQMQVFLGALTVFMVTSGLASADIYQCKAPGGGMLLTNMYTGGDCVRIMKESKRPIAPVPAATATGSVGSTLISFDEIISRYATHYGLDDSLVRAVIKAESNYNPQARSNKGAQGLMQLIPETARDMQVGDPFDPEENIRGGSRYLRLMLDEFGGNVELALAAYNAGPNAVKRFGGIPPYQETQNYVVRVKNYHRQYRREKGAVL
jgi:soluble lytic murein transglycosylase-like protein